MMSNNIPLGLYIHIPFCLKKCSYCDFFSGVANDDLMDKYLSALLQEIDSYATKPALIVDTIFLGGGTPTLFGTKRLACLLDKIQSTFSVSSEAEITVEMNPATADANLLSVLRQLGVNRISLGVQSFVDSELKILGRVHDSQDAVEAVRLITNAGFDNFNLDLMYAIPHQTTGSFMYSLQTALNFFPAHLSVYSLILEEGTEFWKRKDTLIFPDEGTELQIYELCASKLSLSGFHHYEISNYAQKGRECRHNLKYWTLQPYIGIGAAAHSFWSQKRFANPSNLAQYLSNPGGSRVLFETSNQQNLSEEYLMLGLRTSQGISVSRFNTISQRDLFNERKAFINRCLEEEYILINGDNLRLTEKGFYLSTAIIAEFLA